jgi:hypothetical protein
VGVPDDLPIEEMDAEDLDLAQSMCELGLTKFMELKTRVLNAKHKLQTSDMQRGVLPQTEEGKEDICVEADTIEKIFAEGIEAERGIIINIPKGYIEARYIETPQENLPDFRKEKDAIGRIPNITEGVFVESRILRRIASKLHENGNGNTPQIRKDKYIS